MSQAWAAWTNALVGIVGFVVSLFRRRAKRRTRRATASRPALQVERRSKTEFVLRNVGETRLVGRIERLGGLHRVPECVDLGSGEGCRFLLFETFTSSMPTDLTVWVDGRAEPVHVPVPSERA